MFWYHFGPIRTSGSIVSNLALHSLTGTMKGPGSFENTPLTMRFFSPADYLGKPKSEQTCCHAGALKKHAKQNCYLYKICTFFVGKIYISLEKSSDILLCNLLITFSSSLTWGSLKWDFYFGKMRKTSGIWFFWRGNFIVNLAGFLSNKNKPILSGPIVASGKVGPQNNKSWKD